MYKQEVKIKKSAIKDVCTGGEQWLVQGAHEVNGQKFADGTLVFCGFQGNKVPSAGKDVWVGVYLFDTAGSKTPEKSITVAELNKALHLAPVANSVAEKSLTTKK